MDWFTKDSARKELAMSEYELAAKRILEARGFTNVQKRQSGCDLDAEKNGVQHLIEVKGGSQGEVFPLPGPKWSQIRELDEASNQGKKALLMFINANYFEFAIFEMVESGPIKEKEAILALLNKR
jgi:hypothetical protein